MATPVLQGPWPARGAFRVPNSPGPPRKQNLPDPRDQAQEAQVTADISHIPRGRCRSSSASVTPRPSLSIHDLSKIDPATQTQRQPWRTVQGQA